MKILCSDQIFGGSIMSGCPRTSRTTTLFIVSGARVGRFTTSASSSRLTLKGFLLGSESGYDCFGELVMPCRMSLPSIGHLKTWRYNRVPPGTAFCVHRPHSKLGNGLALVP